MIVMIKLVRTIKAEGGKVYFKKQDVANQDPCTPDEIGVKEKQPLNQESIIEDQNDVIEKQRQLIEKQKELIDAYKEKIEELEKERINNPEKN